MTLVMKSCMCSEKCQGPLMSFSILFALQTFVSSLIHMSRFLKFLRQRILIKYLYYKIEGLISLLGSLLIIITTCAFYPHSPIHFKPIVSTSVVQTGKGREERKKRESKAHLNYTLKHLCWRQNAKLRKRRRGHGLWLTRTVFCGCFSLIRIKWK